MIFFDLAFLKNQKYGSDVIHFKNPSADARRKSHRKNRINSKKRLKLFPILLVGRNYRKRRDSFMKRYPLCGLKIHVII